MKRRHVHGSTFIDERAIMLEGATTGTSVYVDSYYYLLQELYIVAGLIKKNGTLAEAYTYDTYGKVSPWGYRVFDFDRDGDVDSADQTTFATAQTSSGVPTLDPKADGDMDGDADTADRTAFLASVTGSGTPPVTLFTSGVGNRYHFTGRKLHWLEDKSTAGVNANEQIQHNRNRHYDPDYGRWLQRDPAGYVDGMGLYEYVGGRPLLQTDRKSQGNSFGPHQPAQGTISANSCGVKSPNMVKPKGAHGSITRVVNCKTPEQQKLASIAGSFIVHQCDTMYMAYETLFNGVTTLNIPEKGPCRPLQGVIVSHECAILKILEKALKQGCQGINIECRCWCPEGDYAMTRAPIWGSWANLQLCPLLGENDIPFIKSTILHELTHYGGSTDDIHTDPINAYELQDIIPCLAPGTDTFGADPSKPKYQ